MPNLNSEKITVIKSLKNQILTINRNSKNGYSYKFEGSDKNGKDELAELCKDRAGML